MLSALGVRTCRQRLLEVLSFVDEHGPVVLNAAFRLVEESTCPEKHELHFAAVNTLLELDEDGQLVLNEEGKAWLLENGRPPACWMSAAPPAQPLRQWQVEALDAWANHGRVGVVEAVTGTGKSRVGIEAIREALAEDYTAVVAVPSVELVHQWLRALKAHGIRGAAQYDRNSWRNARVVVGTVQAMYAEPPARFDGKVLLVADECHRYGAEQWSQILHHSYRRRLGLTATFERNDDGLTTLMDYFGGEPVYRIGFARAIADEVVAPYDVKLVPVELTASERAQYDELDEMLSDSRVKLIAAGLTAEPFGTFLHEVKQAAEDDDDPTVSDVAGRYLSAFSKRVELLSDVRGKLEALTRLTSVIDRSRGALFFTRRIDAAEAIAAKLQEEGIKAGYLHSSLTRTQRRERLDDLRFGRVKALVAPTALDEGVDVPEVDLGVVMAGSRSRRQMIQRMGRVLRKKGDGRSATFVVVFAKDTVEDLDRSDGQVGCLDLIVQSASSVERVDLDGRPAGTTDPHRATVDHSSEEPVEAESEACQVPDRPAGEGERLPGRLLDAEGVPANPASDFIHGLERLARLHERGLLTEGEFALAKSRLLS